MDTKTEQNDDSGSRDVNIAINGEPDSTNVKNMDADEGSRAGLTKDELMKYANEPFWIRLRNFLFAAFWIVWISILIAAIAYVVKSPGCMQAAAQQINANSSSTAAPRN